ncbi:MAG: TSUP family transporter [Candidatus Dormibacteria bacterium]
MTVADSLAVLAVLIGAGASAVTGIGFALVCAPVLTIALGGGDGVRIANALAIGVNLLLIRREWRNAVVGDVLMLLVPAAVAIAAVAWAIRSASPHVLSVASGALILVAVGALVWGARVAPLAGRAGAVIAGAVSGAMNVVGGVGGPAVASYALNARWPPEQTRPTLAIYFLAINVVSVASRGVPGLSGIFVIAAVVALVVGFGLGALLARRLDARMLRSGTLMLAALGAGAAIAQGLR